MSEPQQQKANSENVALPVPNLRDYFAAAALPRQRQKLVQILEERT